MDRGWLGGWIDLWIAYGFGGYFKNAIKLFQECFNNTSIIRQLKEGTLRPFNICFFKDASRIVQEFVCSYGKIIVEP